MLIVFSTSNMNLEYERKEKPDENLYTALPYNTNMISPCQILHLSFFKL